jgi:hypothetical protein
VGVQVLSVKKLRKILAAIGAAELFRSLLDERKS